MANFLKKLFIVIFITTSQKSFINSFSLQTSETTDFKNLLTSQLLSANTSIDGLLYKFDSTDILKILNQKGKDGVKFRFLCDKLALPQAKQLKQYGDIYEFKSSLFDKLHAKAILIDNTTLLIGSPNFDKSSISTNMEILLKTNEPILIKQFNDLFNKALENNNK